MTYDEFDPSPALADSVERIWTLEGHARDIGNSPQPVLPDGRAELILHFGDRFDRLRDDGGIEHQARLLFAGQLTSQLLLRPTGRVSVLGIRFHPHGAAALLRIPQHELSGATVELDALSAPLARTMRHVQERATTLADAVAAAQASLEPLMDRSAVDARVRHVAAAIARYRGRVSIERLAASAGLTRRHLERQFQIHVGVSPKRLARITRFQHALRFLDSTDAPGRGATTAAACGYADQSHFVREFKQLAGTAPTEYLLQRGELTGFFAKTPV